MGIMTGERRPKPLPFKVRPSKPVPQPVELPRPQVTPDHQTKKAA
jgi:hypothetical protein